ncbi:MAG: ABC transporter substrate-binding protein [Clostridia bacterium]|nr:ABC transporter substrate-binding protein [Clostridia bacterium]
MKRLLALILSLIMVLSGMALANASEDALVVGSTTRMSGDFFAGLWSSNTADIDVRALLHDAHTVSWLAAGNYDTNKNVISNVSITKDAQGNQIYKFKIQPDLKYSDGSAITAKDYVFSVLLLSAPQIVELGAANTNYAHLVGWEEYAAEAAVFSGVRLISDDTFSLTVKAKNLPYFYHLSLVDVAPYPMAVIAPECDVKDDGEGAYITGDFTAELLSKTLLNAETGYVSHPSVVSGAYCLTSYDAAQGVAEFEINPYYMGNYEGQKPSIQKIVFRCVTNDTFIEEIKSGKLDLVNKVSVASVIDEAMAEEGINNTTYPRMGLAYIAFACEEGAKTSSLALRKAVALSLDREAICEEFIAPHGRVVNAYYGLGQWMAVDKFQHLKTLKSYELNLEGAEFQLKKSGYAGDTLKMAIPENNAIANGVVAQLEKNFAKIGLNLEVTVLPMNVLLQHYYRQVERTYDLFFLASNFNYVFDPYLTYHTDDAYQGVWNRSGLKDEQLMKLANAMRRVDASDKDEYKSKWINFQKYWVEVLPAVPLYSNNYFDFYSDKLENYSINSYSTWAQAIISATMK